MNFVQDILIFDLNKLTNVMTRLKQQMVGIVARLYDPLGFMSPV